MDPRTEWTGTASDLLGALSEEVGETVRRAKIWPATARALSGRIRRAATFLRKVGIDIAFEREGRARTRTIRIFCRLENATMKPSAPSAASSISEKPTYGNSFEVGNMRTVEPGADAISETTERRTVREKPVKTNDEDAADGADANIHSLSGSWRGQI